MAHLESIQERVQKVGRSREAPQELESRERRGDQVLAPVHQAIPSTQAGPGQEGQRVAEQALATEVMRDRREACVLVDRHDDGLRTRRPGAPQIVEEQGHHGAREQEDGDAQTGEKTKARHEWRSR